MNYDAWFQCSEGCDETYPLTEIIYRCRNCDGLLEVRHDIDVLKQRSAADWKTLFEQRYMRTQYPYGSGVWGKKNSSAQTLMMITSSPCMRVAPTYSGQNGSVNNSAYTTYGLSNAVTATRDPLKTSG